MMNNNEVLEFWLCEQARFNAELGRSPFLACGGAYMAACTWNVIIAVPRIEQRAVVPFKRASFVTRLLNETRRAADKWHRLADIDLPPSKGSRCFWCVRGLMQGGDICPVCGGVGLIERCQLVKFGSIYLSNVFCRMLLASAPDVQVARHPYDLGNRGLRLALSFGVHGIGMIAAMRGLKNERVKP